MDVQGSEAADGGAAGYHASLDFALTLEDHWDDAAGPVRDGVLAVGKALGERGRGWGRPHMRSCWWWVKL